MAIVEPSFSTFKIEGDIIAKKAMRFPKRRIELLCELKYKQMHAMGSPHHSASLANLLCLTFTYTLETNTRHRKMLF